MKSYMFGDVKHYGEIRKVLSNVNNLDVYEDWVPGNTLGFTSDYVLITTGITGPSGASSGITNYSATTTYKEFMSGSVIGSTGWVP